MKLNLKKIITKELTLLKSLNTTVSSLSSTLSSLSSTVSGHTTSINNLKTTLSGTTLTFGDLKLTYVTGTCANAGQVDINYPSNYSSTPWLAIPFCAQGGFGACSTVSIVRCTTTYVTVYQYNNGSADMTVGAFIIGKA